MKYRFGLLAAAVLTVTACSTSKHSALAREGDAPLPDDSATQQIQIARFGQSLTVSTSSGSTKVAVGTPKSFVAHEATYDPNADDGSSAGKVSFRGVSLLVSATGMTGRVGV